MTLIILLMVLVIERVALQSSFWQVETHLKRYIQLTQPSINKVHEHPLSLFLFIAAPAVTLAILLYFLNSGFINFLVGLFVLSICIGHTQARLLYRQYLNALGRGDSEAQLLLHEQLSDICPAQKSYLIEEEQESIGESLIWINFVFYATPVFYFVLLGAPGVLFYASLLYLSQNEEFSSSDESERKWMSTWLGWMFWLPSRLVSLGFMIVGHFTNGLEIWLKYAVNLSKTSREMLCKVALKADNPNQKDEHNNAEHMVKLTKRNMILFIVFVALLTLYGQVV